MDDYSDRIPVYKSTPVLRNLGTGSVRSYDSRVMELYDDPEDDDFGFKSMPQYALQRLFSRDANTLSLSSSMNEVDRRRPIPRMVLTPDSPGTVRKKRRAPAPPSGLVAARQKFPSSDDIVDKKTKHHRTQSVKNTRPMSLSPNLKASNLLDELLLKMNNQSPSPSSSPKVNRTKTLLDKIRSPRLMHKSTRRKRTTSKEDEEAGFKPLSYSNSSSLDEPDGFPQETLYFVLLPLEFNRDTEFEVRI